ncbi:unnamed protein product, partial [Durusdinium trenchii]
IAGNDPKVVEPLQAEAHELRRTLDRHTQDVLEKQQDQALEIPTGATAASGPYAVRARGPRTADLDRAAVQVQLSMADKVAEAK